MGVADELLQHVRLLEDQGGNDVDAVLLLVFLVREESSSLEAQVAADRLVVVRGCGEFAVRGKHGVDLGVGHAHESCGEFVQGHLELGLGHLAKVDRVVLLDDREGGVEELVRLWVEPLRDEGHVGEAGDYRCHGGGMGLWRWNE